MSSIDWSKGAKHLVETEANLQTLPSRYVLPLTKSPLLVSNTAFPTVDLSGLHGPAELRLSTVAAISSACAEWGFFRIINHGIEMSLMEEMINVVIGFFDLAWEEKMKYASEDLNNPVRYGTSLSSSKEHALYWRDYLRHYGHPIDNYFHLWPNNPPTYRNVAKKFLEEVWELALLIAGAMSEGLGLDIKYIEESFGEEGFQLLGCNYYPPCPEPDRTLGLAAHRDHGMLTILMQNEVDGLQVKHNEDWFTVNNVPGTFVVNVGDYLEILSNGRYKSLEHRGVVNTEKMRLSLAMSHGPELTARIQPASPLVDEKSDIKYKPITHLEYMNLQQSGALRGKSPLQSLMAI